MSCLGWQEQMSQDSGIQWLCDQAVSPIMQALDLHLAQNSFTDLGSNGMALLNMLKRKNGFYAFESALHVFPVIEEDLFLSQDIIRWNLQATWKYAYDKPLAEAFCFAEDIFGYQFCTYQNRIGSFNPETGNIEIICETVEQWAELICSDLNMQTGYPLAYKWQEQHGPLKAGNRLVPMIPFVMEQAKYEVSNLYEVVALAGMLSRADLARQIKDLPDGVSVRMLPINLQK